MNDAKPWVSLVKILVSDLERAVAYYRDVLSFEEPCTAGEVALGLYVPGMGGGSAAPGGSTGFQLQVADLPALPARLGEDLYTSADGMPCLEITDPDGNVLHVIRPAPEVRA